MVFWNLGPSAALVTGDSSLIPLGDRRWVIGGRTSLRELEEGIGLRLPESRDYVTVAGYLMTALGRVLQPGDRVTLPEARLTVLEMDGHRVETIQVTLSTTVDPGTLVSPNLSMVVVDEAHCISEWGHDFRPEYRRIRPIINEIGPAPIIALTATATPKVQHDIQKNLDLWPHRLNSRHPYTHPVLQSSRLSTTSHQDYQDQQFCKY